VTVAQQDAVRWLLARGIRTGIRGGTFVQYYTEKKNTSWNPSTGRQHAYRRTGGRLLANMEREGLVVRERWIHGVPEYRLTEAAIREAT